MIRVRVGVERSIKNAAEENREKLGLNGVGYVDIINVKLGDPMLVDMLVRQPGYFNGKN